MAGDGKLVQVDEDHSSPSAPYNLLHDRFDETLAFAEQWNDTALDYLQRASELFEQFSMTPGWEDVIRNIVINNVPPFQWTTIAGPGAISLSDDWPTIFPTLGVIKGAPALDTSYTKPVAPTGVNPVISYSPTGYSDTMALKVFTEVWSDLENGGVGLSASVIDAMMLSNQIQNSRIDSTKYDYDMRAAGANGHRFSSGVIAGIVIKYSEDKALRDSQFNSEIIKMNFELARKNKEFSIEKGLDYDRITREFYNNKENRTLQAEIAAKQLIAQVYELKLRAFETEWRGVESQLRASTLQIDTILKENELTFNVFKEQMNAIGIKTQIIASQNDSKIKAYEGEVKAYEAKLKAIEAYYNSLSTYERMRIDAASLQLQKAVEEVKAKLQGKLSYDTLTSDLVKAISQLAKEAVASALNAVNASASMGYTGSESVNETWTHSDSISENYTIEPDTNTLF